MALRIGSRDRSTEDYRDAGTNYGFPGAVAGQWSSIGPHSDITKAMAQAAGWPGPGLGPMPPTGINRPGQGAVPGVWSPGVGYGAFNPNAPVYSTQGNPMGYGANSGWSGPGNPHSGGWGLGVFGAPMGGFGGFGSPEGMAEAGGEIGYSGGFGDSSESGRNR